jgi:hypothetical protein
MLGLKAEKYRSRRCCCLDPLTNFPSNDRGCQPNQGRARKHEPWIVVRNKPPYHHGKGKQSDTADCGA